MEKIELIKDEDFNKVNIIAPSLPNRIKSMFIDSIVIIVLMFLASKLLELMHVESTAIRVAIFALVFMYEPIMVSYKRTIGQKIMKIRVRDYSKIVNSGDEININFFFSILRYITKLLLGWISLITIHYDNHSRAMHDYISKSVMTIE